MNHAVITGSGGQVGRELQRCRWPSDMIVTAYGKQELDISDKEQVVELIGPSVDVVINAAAYTAVDKAETDQASAWRVNAEGSAILAQRCAELDIPFLHVSTDYVFDGTKGSPYDEDDAVAPVNEYGRSKQGGEAGIRVASARHIIMRTSSVFSEYGANFVKSMLRLGAERPTLRIVDDQISCPTSAADIAEALVRIALRVSGERSAGTLWGTYHFCGGPAVTWYDFAAKIFELAKSSGRTAPVLDRIKAADFPSAARRPAHSAMNCEKIREAFGIDTPSWAARLPQVLQAVL